MAGFAKNPDDILLFHFGLQVAVEQWLHEPLDMALRVSASVAFQVHLISA